MRTIRTKIYKFSELSKEAQQAAIENYRSQNSEIFWADENRETLEAFEKVFPVNIKNWSYGGRGEGVYFEMTCDDAIEELKGQRLATYIWNNYRSEIYSKKFYNGTIRTKPNKYHETNPSAPEFTTWHRYSKIQIEAYNCPLTGYCMDNEILDPIYKFLNKPEPHTNFKDLMEECFDSWIKACNADIEYQNSDETIKETIEANDYEFTREGKQF